MTGASRETGAPGTGSGAGRLGGAWRAEAERAQRDALPDGRIAVTCAAPLGVGGLGRHLQEILAASAARGGAAACISGSTRAAAVGAERSAPRHPLGVPYLISVLRALRLPSSVGVRARAAMVEFDAYAAGRLPQADDLIAFNGQALAQLEGARRAGYRSTTLVSANPHLRLLARRHAHARELHPLEGSWASRLLERNLAEYARAERIYYASDYIRDSFLAEGVPEEKLIRFPLTPDPRYEQAAREPAERFEIAYVGSLSVHKGVPLLIDAVRRLRGLDVRLRLVGGWGTPGMRRFVQQACAEDPRIEVSPGDPLPVLRRASLCVHPAWEDGFGYAPAEALAAGVPLIVSADTGMKELIGGEREGLIVPTGSLDALTEAIQAAARGEILTGPASRG